METNLTPDPVDAAERVAAVDAMRMEADFAPLAAAFNEANGLITAWESQFPVRPSLPQVSIGAGAERFLHR